jgi:hypothetical protein
MSEEVTNEIVGWPEPREQNALQIFVRAMKRVSMVLWQEAVPAELTEDDFEVREKFDVRWNQAKSVWVPHHQ